MSPPFPPPSLLPLVRTNFKKFHTNNLKIHVLRHRLYSSRKTSLIL